MNFVIEDVANSNTEEIIKTRIYNCTWHTTNDDDSGWKKQFKLGKKCVNNPVLFALTIMWLKYDELNNNLLALLVDKIDKKIHFIVGNDYREYLAWSIDCEYLCNITHITKTKFS